MKGKFVSTFNLNPSLVQYAASLWLQFYYGFCLPLNLLVPSKEF